MGNKKEKAFEENIKRLEEIVSKLEQGNIPLEKSVELFEEGIKLTKTCNNELERIENKINILIQDHGSIEMQEYNINGDESDGF